jgi:hypothetical protein
MGILKIVGEGFDIARGGEERKGGVLFGAHIVDGFGALDGDLEFCNNVLLLDGWEAFLASRYQPVF